MKRQPKDFSMTHHHCLESIHSDTSSLFAHFWAQNWNRCSQISSGPGGPASALIARSPSEHCRSIRLRRNRCGMCLQTCARHPRAWLGPLHIETEGQLRKGIWMKFRSIPPHGSSHRLAGRCFVCPLKALRAVQGPLHVNGRSSRTL